MGAVAPLGSSDATYPLCYLAEVAIGRRGTNGSTTPVYAFPIMVMTSGLFIAGGWEIGDGAQKKHLRTFCNAISLIY
ncbi:hypothetical protein LMH87_000305 [Akanthomyces muscarius]|uniref:Uncharacterized protein n=1 Tax=Akanthomyces muscarius TaxID=2231603 RepID=A0A9W8QE98_AKAMU|nr:hypothetical protein LMH87_000305 [Akanthomyces muscarius]KAJ4155039.1 hypothetical protein LMH87_000305 [Akanthomyces muscarius]